MLVIGLCIIVLWRRGFCKKSANYTLERRLRLEDIEVVARTEPENESALGRLERIGNELEAASKPEYCVQLLSMKSLKPNPGSISKSSSFTESTLQEYETPIEI